ncbi:MAG: class I SAM-dependent methyltransferase [Bdellovibrionales bacterium]|nr:class I SAM-dependent methyltransferase [Bdellovibrionales bacterium]
MSSDDLFVSSTQMAAAVNYNRWTYDKFAWLVKDAVLEVGCGVGNFTKMLLANKALRSLYSIDISQAAVDSCRASIEDSRVSFECIDICEVSGGYDFIVCMNVLEHIEDHRTALSHMIDLLNPGGALFLLVPAHQSLYTKFDHAAGHYRRYNKAMMRTLLAELPTESTFTHQMYYFNSVGALGYFAVYGILRKEPSAETPGEISFFDSWIVPAQRCLEGKWIPFGLSLITEIHKDGSAVKN